MNPERFDADLHRRIKPDPETGCWVWQLSFLKTGYGQLSWNGRRTLAHRYVYELLVGPIAEGLQLDHTCRNKRCVNPHHLEPVTRQENMRRTMKTHCKRGHDMAVHARITGKRRDCRLCHNLRRRAA